MSAPANPRELIAETRRRHRRHRDPDLAYEWCQCSTTTADPETKHPCRQRRLADELESALDRLEAALRDTERLRHACLVRVSRSVSFDPNPPTDCADALARSAAIDAARSKL